MPLTWTQRFSRLCKLLGTDAVTDDEERQGRALDLYLASRMTDGRDAEALRFTDDDLGLIGTLAVGQFGVVDVVRCHLDSKVYIRKTMEKRIALRARGQCSPQLERDILIKALVSDSLWAPHLLCAFQTETALKLVMQYADGGNLWDVIESSQEGRISELDLRWWAPQMVSAIDWCHSQGFVHRDIKPHNFVLTPTAHLLLVDFGSAAPLLPPSPSGVQLVPKEYCLVPCGTCDYISPEVLQCHEEALVALELEDDQSYSKRSATADDDGGAYGRETDWWSFGAMVYEMAFGVAPFFASDVGHTYIKIIEHRSSLQLSASTTLSHDGISLLEGVLCDKERRLGRRSVSEIKEHSFFHDVDWTRLHQLDPPHHLHLPQFTYSAVASGRLEDRVCPPEEGEVGGDDDDHFSQPFAFSALFQSSRSLLGASTMRGTPTSRHPPLTRNPALDSFVGFSWGPRLRAFSSPSNLAHNTTSPARPPLHCEPVHLTPRRTFPLGAVDSLPPPRSNPQTQVVRTPVRTNPIPIIYQDGNIVSVPRTGTARRMQGQRPLSDREAMQQLVDCVGMSARKKVLESGKKPIHIRMSSGRWDSKKETKRFGTFSKPLIIDTRNKADVSTMTSDSESQPSSPTPRPGSALSRRSGWGGRSTPSLAAGRSTPTLTFTASGSAAGATGSGSLTKSNNSAAWPENSKRTTSFDEKLRDAERKHDKLVDKLATLEKDIGTVSLHLKGA